MSEGHETGGRERPGRYPRTVTGLVTSLVVTVVLLLFATWALGLFRDQPEIRPEQVDYLDSVAAAQEGKMRPIYLADLPEGWIATGVDVEPGDDPVFGLKMLTEDDKFVGIRQEDSSPGALVAKYVDEEATAAEGYRSSGSVAKEWAGFADDGGDTAYAAEVGDEVVLVYGSAPAEDLRSVVDKLTRAPLGD